MLKKLESVRLTDPQVKVYSQPKIYFLGSINNVQSSVQGSYIEGPNSQFWYS